MTGTGVLFGNTVFSTRGATPVEKARRALFSLTLGELQGASVQMYEQPDITNPSGYYDRWVVLEYRAFFGLIKLEKILFFRRTCDELDEEDQKRVYRDITSILQVLQ